MHSSARRLILATALLFLTAASPAPSPNQIVAAAPPTAWQSVPADNLLVMDLASGRRIVIELAPAFTPVHVENIRKLAHAGWWDGASIVRVQDNYVVQWADGPGHGLLPAGVVAHPPAEYDRPIDGLAIRRLGFPDSYAPMTGYSGGWPVAGDGKRVWLTHCYAMVGVGRDMPPDTGDGTELYAVIGQAPRQLDRNIALVGRVLDGMPALAALPRGSGDLGFYVGAEAHVPIRRVRMAADLPPAERPHYDVMRSDAPDFARYLDARSNRRDPFFVRPAGGVDVCNAPVPTRPSP